MRAQLVRSLAFSAISPIALGLPVLIVLLWLSIKRGLMPLTDLSRAIVSRKPDSLVYFHEANTPWELRPIVLALNDLLKRVTRMLEGERRFTDNAAHELRTPLAAIEAHLFAACNAKDEAEKDASIRQARIGVGRGIRLVGQMLTLARLEPNQIQPDFVPLHMKEMAQGVCAELAPLALAREQTLELIAEPNLPAVKGNIDMLSMLMSNLVDNAIRYTREGGHIIVMVKATDRALVLAVNDDGPGIPPEEREHVFQRFYRLADKRLPGTGLGLAICRSIADLHHAQISLSDTPTGTGLCVQVTFPI
jgi:two-component system sensor histidine kinase QseC